MAYPETSLPKIIKSCLLGFLVISIYSANCLAEPSSEQAIVHPDFSETRQSLLKIIEVVRNEYNIPGLSVIVTRGQRNIWAEGFGLADIENQIPATAHTIYRAGSLAKPLTAIAIMQLAEKGIIDIDQPVIAYLTEFKIKSRFDTTKEPVTLRNIMCHHSGLPTDLNKEKWSDQPFTTVVEKLGDEFTAYPPNMVFSYSNIGFTLLGHIIEKVQPLAYGKYMQANVFQPAGMKNTMLAASFPVKQDGSKGYSNGNGQVLLPIRDVPAYGLMTSVWDLGQLMKTFFNRDCLNHSNILLPETLEEMLEPQNTDIALDMNIINGLGWFIEPDPDNDNKLLVRHGGTTLYFSSELIFSPEDNLGVAILANASGSRQIVSELTMEIFKRFRSVNSKTPHASLTLEQIIRQVESPLDAKIAGDYATDLGLISIQAKDDNICGCIANQTFDLIPYPNGWLGIKQDAVDSLPPSYRALGGMQYKSQVIDGVEVIVARYNNTETVLGQKVPTIKIPDAWKKRTGIYRVQNPDELFPIKETELFIEDGMLYMRYKMPLLSSRPIQSPLQPISDDEAIILGLGRTRGETIRAYRKGQQEHVHYSGYYGIKMD